MRGCSLFNWNKGITCYLVAEANNLPTSVRVFWNFVEPLLNLCAHVVWLNLIIIMWGIVLWLFAGFMAFFFSSDKCISMQSGRERIQQSHALFIFMWETGHTCHYGSRLLDCDVYCLLSIHGTNLTTASPVPLCLPSTGGFSCVRCNSSITKLAG